ncbi:MAG: hypothetical protein JNL54_13655 [Kineosporiaceae bacterium]|nr:hypothetical protein [Kineosporiaceae bacterium]
MLLVLGVNQRAVMRIMRWSTGAMTQHYQHLVPEVLRDVADQMGQTLWAPHTGESRHQTETGTETDPPAADQETG